MRKSLYTITISLICICVKSQDTIDIRHRSFSLQSIFTKIFIDSFSKKVEFANNTFGSSVNIYPRNMDIRFFENRFQDDVNILDRYSLDSPEKGVSDTVNFYSYKNNYSTIRSKSISYDSFSSELDIQILSALIQDCSFKSFYVHLSTIKQMQLTNIDASSLVFDSCSIFNLQMIGKLPDTISFSDCRLNSWYFDFHIAKNHVIYIDGEFNYDIPLFAKPISRYSFVFGKRVNLEKAEKFMRKVLELQKEIGTTNDIRKADILLKEVQINQGNFSLWFQKQVWLYGYDKGKLFTPLLVCSLAMWQAYQQPIIVNHAYELEIPSYLFLFCKTVP